MDPIPADSAPPETSWESLAHLLNLSNPLFDQTLFLLGYDFSSNIYLIKGDYLTLIDAGNDYTAFMELFDLGVNLADIKKIVLTHGHVDHCMGAVELFRAYRRGSKELDVEIILHEAGPQEFKNMAKEIGYRLTEVKGGEILSLSGFDFEVVHTPGHTLDSICLYHGPSRTLFSGDVVLAQAMAEPDQGGGGRMDHYLYSLRTLRKKDLHHVMPGHGPIVASIGQQIVADTYEGLIKKVVGLETPWLAGAMQLAQQGLLEEALFYSNKELAENPENARALEMKAFVLNDLGRSNEALEVFDKILAQDSRHFYALLGKGAALLGQGQYAASLEYFDRALKIKPMDQETLLNKGLALYLGGRHDEALDIEIFQKEFTSRLKQELEGRPQTP
jgi:glyoxylase-like metal-dependent hydrolase (beta-lactamase superfamily II)